MLNIFLTASVLENQSLFLRSSLIILYLILAALALSCLVFTFIMLRSQLEGTASKVLLVSLYLVTSFVLVCTIICTREYSTLQVSNEAPSIQITDSLSGTEAGTSPVSTTVPPTEPSTEPTEPFLASHVSKTDPANWEIKWNIMKNSTVLESYVHPDEIHFDDAESYTAMEGIITFRGNNYRNSATYGTSNIVNQTITEKWRSRIGSFNGWTGCGWTGQPLIVRWDENTKAIMNLYEEKKAKPDLVEVIYATLAGHIYF